MIERSITPTRDQVPDGDTGLLVLTLSVKKTLSKPRVPPRSRKNGASPPKLYGVSLDGIEMRRERLTRSLLAGIRLIQEIEW